MDMMASLFYLDYWTKVAIEAIWKEQVQQTIQNDLETGVNDDEDTSQTWELVESTPFTEPFWGIVVNR
jgi:hypothetical protein